MSTYTHTFMVILLLYAERTGGEWRRLLQLDKCLLYLKWCVYINKLAHRRYEVKTKRVLKESCSHDQLYCMTGITYFERDLEELFI